MAQDRLLAKPERAEFEELIAMLRGQYNYSWSELSTAAGYTAPGGARKAHDSHYTNVHLSNLTTLRRTIHDVRKGIKKPNGHGTDVVHHPREADPVKEKVWDGGVKWRHSLSEKRVETQKPLLPELQNAADAAAKKKENRPPAWYLAQKRSDLKQDEKDEFAASVKKALGMGFSYADIALRIGYKTPYGLQRTIEAGVQGYTTNLLQLRHFMHEAEAGRIQPAPRGRRTRVPAVPLTGVDRKRAEALVRWLRECGYGNMHIAYARGARTAQKPVSSYYQAHYYTLLLHIRKRGESPEEIFDWYTRGGIAPYRNTKFPPPLQPEEIAGATHEFRPTVVGVATVTGGTGKAEPSAVAPAAPPATPTPAISAKRMTTAQVLEVMSNIKDSLVRQSEILGNQVARVDNLLTAECPPFLKAAIQDARNALAAVNDNLIGAISNHFEG